MKTEDLKNIKDYKYGFTTDVENIRSPKGLSEETIRFISSIKKEPKWMLEWRLKAFNRLKALKEPGWQKPKYPKINYQELKKYLMGELAWNKLINGLFYRLTSISDLEVDELVNKNPSLSIEQAENLVIQRQLDLQSSKLLRDIMNEATVEYK